MKRLSQTLLLLPLALWSCQNAAPPQDPSTDGFTISSGNPQDDLIWCDLVESATYIPLETSRASLIGEIKKIVIWKDNLIIWDNTTYQLLRFSTDGKFRNLIAEPGENPGQYRSLNDFFLDTLNGTIHCLDPSINQMLLFNLEGKFLSLGTSFEQHQLTPIRVHLFGDKLYTFTPPAFNKKDNFLVHKFALDGTLENRFFSGDHTAYSSYAVENVTMSLHPEMGVLFFKNFDPNIYRENEAGQLVAFGKLQLPRLADPSFLREGADYIAMIEQLSASGQTQGIESIKIVGNQAWFTYASQGNLYYNLQDLQTGQTISFKQISSSPSLCPFAKIIGHTREQFIGQVYVDQDWIPENPELRMDSSPEMETNPKYQLIRDWLEAWKTRSASQDNPIIALYTFHGSTAQKTE